MHKHASPSKEDAAILRCGIRENQVLDLSEVLWGKKQVRWSLKLKIVES